eukprot:CAMPEP_0197266924 /NCGR_PEP_ID=MMETSP1432-20130617/3290_1 /TAXON_ID=44447 /ORGANISM="Pseudo-nitzschia delicatissima, Strain UNC1205" /LENGTH=401 /DNA_ID=CAMNT_0042731831 /DNA_START=43 /DNA_END=1248 /DNA_ORIENTATION=+
MASLLGRLVVTAVIVVALAANADAFAPSTTYDKQRSTALCSTMDKKDKEQKQAELFPPQEVGVTPKCSAGIKIAPIAPLGASTRFGNTNPLKEFPTYEMKKRFRKIRSPRKQFTKIPTKIDPPNADIVIPPNNKSCPPLVFGIGEFFDTELLVRTVRENADVGKPLESTRSLADKLPLDNNNEETMFLSCGSASCTQGGWPSKIPASNKTQLFYLLSGFGCLTDMDGARHYFGPGDTVVVPRNWAGRVDVAEDLHKIWFALDYETVEDEAEEGPMVRAKVIHYHELVKWSFKGTNDKGSVDDAHKSEKLFTTIQDFGMGLSCITAFSPATSTSVAPKFHVSPRKYNDCFHLLEGTMVLKPFGGPNEPTTFEFTSGDTVVLPKGWTGTCEIKDPVKALRVKA